MDARIKSGHDEYVHYAPVLRVNQRISGKETARGRERTVFKKPATCGGKAIS